jgi:hypothetical protein
MKLPHALLLLPLCGACVTVDSGSVSSSAKLEHSYGSVVSGDLDRVWSAVSATMAQLGGPAADIDTGAHTASASHQGADITVRAQRRSASQTILRVQASRDGQEDTALAEQVLMAIQRRLF